MTYQVHLNGEVKPLAFYEEKVLRFALRQNCGNIAKTARDLRIARATLHRKIKVYGINVDAALREAIAAGVTKYRGKIDE